MKIERSFMFLALWTVLLIESVVEAYSFTENGYYFYIPADRVCIDQLIFKHTQFRAVLTSFQNVPHAFAPIKI